MLIVLETAGPVTSSVSSIGTAIEQHFSVWGHGGIVGCRGDVGGWAPRLGDG